MDLIEIVRIRSMDGREKRMVLEALRNPDDAMGAEIKIFRNAIVASDLGIHLCWKGSHRDPTKSPLGLQLAHAFKRFGLINHSVWVEEREEGGAL